MKMYGGVDIWINIFLTSALFGGDWSASCPATEEHLLVTPGSEKESLVTTG
jgi:hypothetical protein